MRNIRQAFVVALLLVALGLSACTSADEAGKTSHGGSAGTKTKVTQIAFFGFWKTNTFTQAVLKGVRSQAKEAGIEVVDRTTATYDAAAQMKAVQDETVGGKSQMYVILADDSVSMASAAKQAIAQDITVVAAFTPLGAKFDTLEPQVPGLVVVGETPVANGTVLGELGVSACGSVDPCKVAYLEGIKALPLDNARTRAALSAIEKDPAAQVVAQLEGGYTVDTGKKAAQDALQRDPDINVMIGSSQAMLGAQQVVDTSKVKLIGNGSSKEAYAAVNSGAWFALYNLDVIGMGAKAVAQGLLAASGESVEPFDTQKLLNPHGTKDVIKGQTSEYSDLG